LCRNSYLCLTVEPAARGPAEAFAPVSDLPVVVALGEIVILIYFYFLGFLKNFSNKNII
jgi:hypothetical protein